MIGFQLVALFGGGTALLEEIHHCGAGFKGF